MNESIKDVVNKRFEPFKTALLNQHRQAVHSLHITGSAVTEDYNQRLSDINSVLVFKQMDLSLVEALAPLGNKFRKQKIAAPLIMTPDYIQKSLDVFPIEFLNISLFHQTVFGEDIFKDLAIERAYLRLQCERELKVQLIGLRQGYLGSLGKPKTLTDGFVGAVAGYISLFRGIIYLLGHEVPSSSQDVISTLQDASGITLVVIKRILEAKQNPGKMPKEILNRIFEDCYTAIEKLGDMVDEI